MYKFIYKKCIIAIMREKIRDLDIRLTELADYLKISRSSLYNYIDYYESNNKKAIPFEILKLFQYIDKSKNLSKEMVIKYIMTHFFAIEGRSIKDDVIVYLNGVDEDDVRLPFIDKLIKTNEMDSLIPYLTRCLELMESDDLSDSDIIQLAKFVTFKNDIEKNNIASSEEIKMTEKILCR